MSRRLKSMMELNASSLLDPAVVFPDGSVTWVPPEPESQEEAEAFASEDCSMPAYTIHYYHHYPERPSGWHFWMMGGSIALLLSITYLFTQNSPAWTLGSTNNAPSSVNCQSTHD